MPSKLLPKHLQKAPYCGCLVAAVYIVKADAKKDRPYVGLTRKHHTRCHMCMILQTTCKMLLASSMRTYLKEEQILGACMLLVHKQIVFCQDGRLDAHPTEVLQTLYNSYMLFCCISNEVKDSKELLTEVLHGCLV